MESKDSMKLLNGNRKTMLYTREHYTLAESLYNSYMEMRKSLNNLEKIKYEVDDKYFNNEDYKQGFVAGVKIMSSFFLDM